VVAVSWKKMPGGAQLGFISEGAAGEDGPAKRRTG